MSEAYIFEGLRSPIGKGNGALAGVRPDDLLADVLAALVKKTNIKAEFVEDVITGCVTQVQEQGVNVGRNAALAAGFPVTVCGTTVNRLCGSSQQASSFAAGAVMSGANDLVIAAGTESMSRIPMGSDAAVTSERILDRFDIIPQGLSAELIAEKWNMTREELNKFSYESHQKALKAIDEGKFASEIVPISANGKTVTTDEGPRRDTSLEKLANLKPAFKADGKISAGNSSQISDGAAALLIGNETAAKKYGLKPKARFVATAVAGIDPTIMLTGPIPATQKVLAKAGLTINDIDLIEINEAFAPVVISWLKECGADPKKVNVNGGAIALGHPLGASGARLLTTLVHEMERRKARYGLVTMCIGFGQATATIIERCP
ncbi:MAG TPA: thiolase family protein [Bdellovibrionales bacterium]|nr:thiolase family protein [Bdellovibrionales bacterium]